MFHNPAGPVRVVSQCNAFAELNTKTPLLLEPSYLTGMSPGSRTHSKADIVNILYAHILVSLFPEKLPKGCPLVCNIIQFYLYSQKAQIKCLQEIDSLHCVQHRHTSYIILCLDKQNLPRNRENKTTEKGFHLQGGQTL